MPRSGLYVQLDANYGDDDKIESVGLAGAGLYAISLGIAKRLLTDGRLTREKLRRVGADDALIDECVAAGLYRADGDDVWIVAWLDHNPSAADVDDKRAKDAARKRQTRAKRPRGQASDSTRTPAGRADTVETETEEESQAEEPQPSSQSDSPPVAPEAANPGDDGGVRADRRWRAMRALRIVADRRVAVRVAAGASIGDPDAYAGSILADLTRQHGSTAHEHAHTYPDWTPERIADALCSANPHDDSPAPASLYAHADARRAEQDALADAEPKASPETVKAQLARARALIGGGS